MGGNVMLRSKRWRWISTDTQPHRTYGSARVVTPAECGLTQASHSHQNPKQTPQTPHFLPHWTESYGVRVGAAVECQSLFGRCSDDQVHGGQWHAFCQRTRAPGSPVPQCLSSPRAVPPPILLFPSGHTAHPGLPTVERRCSPWVTVPESLGPTACFFVLVVLKNVRPN